ncbi:MAG TPA: hypothetical protein VLA34_05340, partial [Candidatus Krumholzibacterium sp.]|nr:hypothetical protein [Candidatus Krumholzibacterium sp.]
MNSDYRISGGTKPGCGIRAGQVKTLIAGMIYLILGVTACRPARGGVDAAADSVPGPPPGTYRILSDDGSIRVPFRLHRGDVLMTCRLNGRPLRLMIDNGFLWDEILLFGSP